MLWYFEASSWKTCFQRVLQKIAETETNWFKEMLQVLLKSSSLTYCKLNTTILFSLIPQFVSAWENIGLELKKKKVIYQNASLRFLQLNPLGIRQLTTDAVDRAWLVFTLEHLLMLTGQNHHISITVTERYRYTFDWKTFCSSDG